METTTRNSSKCLRIIIAGGNGALGRALIRLLPFPSAEYIILSRKRGDSLNGAKVVYWDGVAQSEWCKELEGADVLINLCGRSVDCRYTSKNKKEILDSRVQPTLALGQAILNCKTPPPLWINAGSATIYRHAEDRPMDEEKGEYGNGFSVGICRQWEDAFNSIVCPETRKIVLRVSMVLGRDHGVLPVLRSLAKKGLGGPMGNGQQKMSWIHEADVAGIVSACILQKDWSGVFNCTAPVPTTNMKFMVLVRKSVKAPFHFRTPAWMLEIGAYLLRTETELMLKSRWVVPGHLIKKHFHFQFNTAVEAIEDLT